MVPIDILIRPCLTSITVQGCTEAGIKLVDNLPMIWLTYKGFKKAAGDSQIQEVFDAIDAAGLVSLMT